MIEIQGENYKLRIIANILELDRFNDNVDVIVEVDSGDNYTATLFTPLNVLYYMSKDKVTGEDGGGLYFWAPDLVIIEELTVATIQRLVEHLLSEEIIHKVFVLGDRA